MKWSFLLPAFGLMAACSTVTDNKENTLSLPVVHPFRVDTLLTQEFVAEIQSVRKVDLRTRVRGFLDAVLVDEGQSVTEGQVLFRMSDKELQEALLSAKAQTRSTLAEVKAAEIELENARNLLEKSVISTAQYQLAQSKLDALVARWEEAKANESNAALQLSFTQIRAPFSGMINRIPFKAGSLVDEGALLTTLSDNKEVFAYFNLSEDQFLDYVRKKSTGLLPEVTLTLANGERYDFTGTIETVEGEIDPETGNIAFRARFPNPERHLRHGATGKVLWPRSVKRALLVPQKAVFEIQDQNCVYVLDSSNALVRRGITTMGRIPRFYVVENGLSEKDRVLLEGIQQVREGRQIEPRLLSKSGMIDELQNP